MTTKVRLSIPEDIPVKIQNRIHDVANSVMVKEENTLKNLEGEFTALKRLDYIFRSDEFVASEKKVFIEALSKTVLFKREEDEQPYDFARLLKRSTGYIDYK